jgi:hypothetical protein
MCEHQESPSHPVGTESHFAPTPCFQSRRIEKKWGFKRARYQEEPFVPAYVCLMAAVTFIIRSGAIAVILCASLA